MPGIIVGRVIRTIRSAADDAAQAFLWAVLAAVVIEKLGKPAGQRLSKKKDSMAKERKRVARLRAYAAEVERLGSKGRVTKPSVRG